MKIILGIVLSFVAIADLISWIKRKKLDGEAIWNSLADILIIIYTLIK